MTLKHLMAIIVLVSATAFAQQAQFPKPQKKSARDSILFKNGDVLFGELQSIDTDKGIRWVRPDALNENNSFNFAPEHITQLELSSLASTNPPASLYTASPGRVSNRAAELLSPRIICESASVHCNATRTVICPNVLRPIPAPPPIVCEPSTR